MSQVSPVKLFPHQQRVVDHMLTHRGLVAVHDTGSGKTIAAISSAAALQEQIKDLHTIVITQVSIMKQFQEEVAKLSLKNVAFYTPKGFAIAMNSTNEKPYLDNTFLIVDEAHNVRTNIKINMKDEVVSGQQAYFIIKAAHLVKKVLLLTATPVINDPFDIYNLVMMVEGIHPDESINKDAFNKAIQDKQDFKDFFGCKTSFYSPSFNTEGLAVRNDEQIIEFVMSNEYYKVYKQIENHHITGDVQVMIDTDAEKDSFYTVLRRAVNADLDGEHNPKIEWVKEFLEEQVANNNKSIVYSNWKSAGMNLVKKALDQINVNYVCISGEMKEDARYKAMCDYNSDKALVLLITKAGSEGLDLKGTRNVVLLESNWHAASEKQIIGRAIRQGSHDHMDEKDRQVDIFRLMMVKPHGHTDTHGSVDEIMYKLAYSKKDPKIQAFLRNVRNCSIENAPCGCNSHRKIIRLKPTKFVSDTSVKRSVTLPSHEEQKIKFAVPTITSLTKAFSNTQLSQYRGHVSYMAMMTCKNKNCQCKQK